MSKMSRPRGLNGLKFVCIVFFFLFIPNLILSNETSNASLIDVNTAPLEELVKIIHIGETRALELISLRPFSSLDDLARIKGIGESRIRDIKDQGLAWASNPESKPESESIPKTNQKELSPIIYPSSVLINELIPSPEGVDNLEEWIELKNTGNEEVNLSQWKIQDITGSITTYAFPEESKIKANGFLILLRPSTEITLNNDGDGLKLIQPDGSVSDSVIYEKAPRAQSYNRTESGWAWSVVLTPGMENIIEQETKTTTPEAIFISSIKEESKPDELTALNTMSLTSKNQKSTPNSLIVLSKALVVAVFSGIAILVLRKKLISKDN